MTALVGLLACYSRRHNPMQYQSGVQYKTYGRRRHCSIIERPRALEEPARIVRLVAPTGRRVLRLEQRLGYVYASVQYCGSLA